MTIDPAVKKALGFDPDDPDEEMLSRLREMATQVCKPCWELKYCPYGPLVEQFPLLPPTRKAAIAHNEYLQRCLDNGTYGEADPKPLDQGRRRWFERAVATFDSDAYPQEIPEEIAELECNVFGHICPVVFAAESFTETAEVRRTGRYIPFKTKMRVARRDNYTCQSCGTNLLDDELEFDHVIPVSKGGSSEESNIRLTCFACNRSKSDDVEFVG